jgi:hypothetical protein
MWEVGTGGKEKKTGAAECKGGLAPWLSLRLAGPFPTPECSTGPAQVVVQCKRAGRQVRSQVSQVMLGGREPGLCGSGPP